MIPLHFRLIGPTLHRNSMQSAGIRLMKLLPMTPLLLVDPAPPAPRGYVPLPSACSSFIHPPPPHQPIPSSTFLCHSPLSCVFTYLPSIVHFLLTNLSPQHHAIYLTLPPSGVNLSRQFHPRICSLRLLPWLPLLLPQPYPLPRRSDRLHPPSPAPPPRRFTHGPKPRDFLYLAFVSAFVADAFPTQVATHLPLFDPIMGLQGHIRASFPTALGYSQSSILDSFGFLSKAKSKPKSDSDTLRCHKAMQAPACSDFKTAMNIEIVALEPLGVWSIVPCSTAESKVIPGMWTFKRKQFPDGRIKKH